MRFRRWALNTALAGAALILAGLIVAGVEGSPTFLIGSVGPTPAPAIVLTAVQAWAAVSMLLGLLALTVAIAWTLGNNARRIDSSDRG